MNIFDLQAKISLNASEFNTGIEQAQGAFQGLGSKIGAGTIAAGQMLGNFATKAAGDVIDFGKDVVNTGKSFESGMSQIAATLGMTTDDIANNVNGAGDTFDALKRKAAEMGRETNFTASQAAEGLNILAMSGFDAESSIGMIGDVLHLAAAGSMEMGSAAGYISGAMKGFADETKDSGYYADLMAKGATLANTSVSQLGEAMSSGAAGAAAYSQNAESMTVALLRLAEQGVVGSAAGTALAASMKDIYTPTDQAAKALEELGVSAYENGKALDFNDIVNNLSDALSGYSEEEANAYKQTIFGIQGLNAFNKMTVTGVETQNEWSNALSGASEGMGEAAKQYETMTDNLQGAQDIFGSALEGFQNAVYEKLRDPLKEATQTAADALGEMTKGFEEGGVKGALSALGDYAKTTLKGIWDNLKLPPELEGIKTFFENIVSAIQPFVDIAKTAIGETFSNIASGVGEFVSAFSSEAAGVIATIADAIGPLFNAFKGAVETKIQTTAAAVSAFMDAFKDSSVFGTLSGIAEYVAEFIGAFSEKAAGIISGIASAVSDFMNGFLSSDAVGAITGVAEAVADFVGAFVEGIGDVIMKVADGVSDLISSFDAEGAGAIIGDIAAGVAEFAEAVVRVGADIVKKLAEGVGKLIDAFRDSGAASAIGDFAAKIAEFVRPFTAGLADIIGRVGEKIGELIGWVTDFAASAISDIPGIIDAASEAFDSIVPMFEAIWDAIKPFIDWLIDVAMASFAATGDIIKGAWEIAVNATKEFFDLLGDLADFVTSVLQGDFEGAAEAIKHAWDGIVDFFKGIWDSIKNIFSGVKEAFADIGSNIVEGIKSGISSAWDTFTSWLGSKVSGLVDGVKNFFGIHSPSTVFAGIGANLVLGLKNGWSSEMNGLVRTVGTDMASLTSVANLDFEKSAIGMSSAAGISSIAAAGMYTGTSRQPVEVNLVLDGEVAAKALFDPLRGVAYQKGKAAELYA